MYDLISKAVLIIIPPGGTAVRKYSGKKVVARAVLIIISLMKTAVKNSARNS